MGSAACFRVIEVTFQDPSGADKCICTILQTDGQQMMQAGRGQPALNRSGRSDHGNGKGGWRHIGPQPRVLIGVEDRGPVTCRYGSGWRRFGVADSELIHRRGDEIVNGVGVGYGWAKWRFVDGSCLGRASVPIFQCIKTCTNYNTFEN